MQSTSAENRVAIWHCANYAQVANRRTAFLLTAFNHTNRNAQASPRSARLCLSISSWSLPVFRDFVSAISKQCL